MLLNLLFPPLCVGCRQIGTVICPRCFSGIIPVPSQVCPYCFQSSRYGHTHGQCRQRQGLDGAFALIHYRGTGKKLIKQCKYQLAHRTFRDILDRFPKEWMQLLTDRSLYQAPFVLQPIPLHPLRLRRRGFNQAELIARFFARHTQSVIVDILQRVKHTKPQAQVKRRAEREANIRGAFLIKPAVSLTGSTIVLVDDLFTSGNTAKEAARVLKQAGARHVFLFTLAHG